MTDYDSGWRGDVVNQSLEFACIPFTLVLFVRDFQEGYDMTRTAPATKDYPTLCLSFRLERGYTFPLVAVAMSYYIIMNAALSE